MRKYFSHLTMSVYNIPKIKMSHHQPGEVTDLF